MNNKTVVDAVNDLKANASNLHSEARNAPNIVVVTCKDDKYINSTEFYSKSLNTSGYFLSHTKPENLIAGVSFVCTIDEFNQCVAEMSEGLFVPDCRAKQAEIQYDKDGNGWEAGAVYEFSNDKKDWYQASFSRMDSSLSEYKPNGLNWHLFARECQSQIGKIHKKPVELVDGAAYQFDFKKCTMVGFYHEDSERFREMNAPCAGVVYDLKYATNIIRLVPEVK